LLFRRPIGVVRRTIITTLGTSTSTMGMPTTTIRTILISFAQLGLLQLKLTLGNLFFEGLSLVDETIDFI